MRIDGFHGLTAYGQILGQLIAVVNAPVHEVGVSQNGPITWGFHLAPISKRPVPSLVEPIQCLIFLSQPLSEPLLAGSAIAEHRLRLVSDSGPVQRRRFTPKI